MMRRAFVFLYESCVFKVHRWIRWPASTVLAAVLRRIEGKTADEEIERWILEGMKDKQGNQRMPPFKQKLSAEDVKLLVGWVKSLRVTK